MRFVKAFGLAAMAALVVMAFVNVASAAAEETDSEIVWCKVEQLLCETKNVVPAQSFEGVAENPELLGNLTVKCPTSEVKGSTLAEMGSTLPVTISSLTFGPAKKCSGCTEVDTAPPYSGEIELEVVEGKHDYWFKTKGSALLLHCTIFNVSCKFGTGTGFVKALIDPNGGLPIILFKKAVLKKEEGIGACGEVGEWDASYTITNPMPIFLALYKL